MNNYHKLTSILRIRKEVFKVSYEVMIGNSATIHNHKIANRFQTQFIWDGRHTHNIICFKHGSQTIDKQVKLEMYLSQTPNTKKKVNH